MLPNGNSARIAAPSTVAVTIHVTAASGTLNAFIQTSNDGTTWTNAADFADVTTTGDYTATATDVTALYYRLFWTIGNERLVHVLGREGPDGHGGILEPYDGIEPEGHTPLPSQLDQLRTLIGARIPDAVLVSTGANDIKFSDVIKHCITGDCTDAGDFPPTQTCTPQQGDPPLTLLQTLFCQLPAKYAALGPAFDALNIPRNHVYLTEYFDQTQNGAGVFTPILGINVPGIYSGGLISSAELQWAENNVVIPLNNAVHDAAAANGFNVVSGIAAEFFAHGYAADDHWVVNISESLLDQRGIDGSFHPNSQGQDVYARHIFGALAPALDINGSAPNWLGFSTTATALTTAGATSVATGDVNGDGLPDLVVGANGSPTQVFLNAGFDSATHTWNGFGTGTAIATAATKAVALGDVNGDGALDLFVGNDGANVLYLNNGTGTFTAAASTFFAAGNENTTAVALADVNGDRKLDLIVANNGAAGGVFLNLASSGSTWNGFALTAAAVIGGSSVAATSLAVGDFDGDALTDIVLGAGPGSGNLLYTNRGGTGSGWLGLRAARVVGDASDNTTGVALVNVTNGSGPDLIVVNNGSPSLLYKPESTKLTRVALANVGAELGPISVKDGAGAFILTPAGLAGAFSGTVAAAGGGFDANISIAVRINQTTLPVDETLELGGRTINIRFSDTEVADTNGPFFQFSGSGVIKLGSFVEIKGTFTFGGGEQTVSDLVVFLGQGPAFLEDGSINPDARGVYLTNASLMAIDVGGKKAFSAVGDVALVGFPGISVSGTVHVKFNETGLVQFDNTPYEVADGEQSFAGDFSLSMLGLEFSGPIAVSRSGNDIVVTLGAELNDGETVDLAFGPVSVSIDQATLAITPTGVIATLTADVLLDLPGVSITGGTFTVLINTTTGPVTSPTDIPARSVRVKAEGLHLTVGGVELIGNFEFEQVTGELAPQAPPGTLPPKITRFAASGVHFDLGGIVTVTDGHGIFVVTPAGLAGRLEATVTAPFLTGTFGVAINTTMKAVAEQFGSESLNLPAGPYLRIEGIGVRIAVAGQRASADVVLEKATVSGVGVVRVLVTNASASFGDGTTSFVTLSGGTGILVMRAGGLAGELSGNVAISIPGVSVSGHFSLAINTSTSDVNETIAFGPAPGATRAVAVGDVNGDGKPDLVVGVYGGKNVLYLNDGTATPFASLPGLVIGDDEDDTTSLALADVDGDGDPDLIVGNAGSDDNRLYLNDGSGVFTLATGVSIGSGAHAVAVGDLNGDGFADIVFGGNGATANAIYLNGGRNATTQAWSGFTQFTTGAFVGATTDTRALVLADLDGDGKLDLVGGSHGAKAHAYLNLGVSSNAWQGFATSVDLGTDTDNTTALATGDLDGDGFADVVVGNDLQASRVYLNLSTAGALAFATGTDVAGTATLATTSLALVDADVDGDLDLVVGVSGAANKLFLNGGTSVVRSGTDGATTNATAAFTAASGGFSSADVGKVVLVGGTRYVVTAFTAAVTGPPAVAAKPDARPQRDGHRHRHRMVVPDLERLHRVDDSLRRRHLTHEGARARRSEQRRPRRSRRRERRRGERPLRRRLHLCRRLRHRRRHAHRAGRSARRLPPGNRRQRRDLRPRAAARGQLPLHAADARERDAHRRHRRAFGDHQPRRRPDRAPPERRAADLRSRRRRKPDGERAGGPAARPRARLAVGHVPPPRQHRDDGGRPRRRDAAPGRQLPPHRGHRHHVRPRRRALRRRHRDPADDEHRGTAPPRAGRRAPDRQLRLDGRPLERRGRPARAAGRHRRPGQRHGQPRHPHPGRHASRHLRARDQPHERARRRERHRRHAHPLARPPSGPYVRIFGTGVQLVVAGQTLSGDFAVEQSIVQSVTQTRIVASNVTLRLGTGTTDLLTITNGSASFLVGNGGIAGTLSGTVALNVPGVTFAGTLRLQINTSTSPFDDDGDSNTPSIPVQTLRSARPA